MKKTFIRSYQVLLAMLVMVMMIPQDALAATEGQVAAEDMQYIMMAKTSKVPNISKITNGKSGLNIYWDQVAKASRYYIYRKIDGNKVYKQIGTTTKLKFYDKTAKSGTTYRYVVKAKVGKKLGGYGKSAAGVRMSPPKAAVMNSDGMVGIAWNKVKNAKGYNIYRKASGESKYKKIGKVSNGNTLQYADKTVTSGTWYYYYVKAYNGKCESKAGNFVKTKYLKRLDFKTTFSQNSENVKVSWTPLKGANGYMVYYSTHSNFSTKISVDMVGAKKDSVTLKELKPNTTYYISVVAYAKDNKGKRYYSVGGKVESGTTGETQEEITQTDAYITIGNRKIWIDMPVEKLGQADDTMKGFCNGSTWYVYGAGDYEKFFAVNVLGGTVRQIIAIGKGFEFQGMKFGSSYKQFVCNDASVEVMIDGNDNRIVHGVVITKKDFLGNSYTDESLAGESKINFHCVNAFRVAHDVNILKWSKAAAKSARLHSQDMADKNYFSHDSLDGRTPWDRLKEQGINYRSAGENIDAGYFSGVSAYNGWVNSAGHRANMLHDFEYLGVGGGYNANAYYRIYFTQDFYSEWNF